MKNNCSRSLSLSLDLWVKFSLLYFCVDLLVKTEWSKCVTVPLVELVLELYPMETQGVQETLHHVHTHQHTESGSSEHREENKHLKSNKDVPE